MPRGERTPDWVNRVITVVFIELRERIASHRWPTAGEVRQELARPVLDEETGERVPRLEFDQIPSLRHIQNYLTPLRERLKDDRPSPSEMELPWSLGLHNAGVPDEATGTVLEVWRWTIMNPTARPLSVRTARWVSKLRWVREAGGNPLGEAVNLEKLYNWALFYSGREWRVETVNDRKGMRSGALDAKLMLSPNVEGLARRIGLLEDDKGIDHNVEFTAIDPGYGKALLNALQLHNALQTGTSPAMVEETRERINELSDIWKEFESSQGSEFWWMYKDEVWALYNMAHKKIFTDPRVLGNPSITSYQMFVVLKELTLSLFEPYHTEQMESWEPDLEQLIQKHLLIND
jgi:hypothetical protein